MLLYGANESERVNSAEVETEHTMFQNVILIVVMDVPAIRGVRYLFVARTGW